LQSIQHRVKYPVNFEDWNKSQKADFRRARYAVADTLSVAAQLVGAETCLDLLVTPLATLSEQVAAGQAFEWRAAEAALYCIRSVCKVREEGQSVWGVFGPSSQQLTWGARRSPALRPASCVVGRWERVRERLSVRGVPGLRSLNV